MEFGYNSIAWSCDNRKSHDGNKTFFIDAPKKRKERINEHHDQIINIYRFWQIIDFPLDLDLLTFDPLRLKITIIENILPRHDELAKEPETLAEMALSHLNCEHYKNAYITYLRIKKCQDSFNANLEEFLRCNGKHLEHLMGSNNMDNVKSGELLRYYLYKIMDANLQSNGSAPTDRVKRFGRAGELSNPFPDKEEIINKDALLRHSDVFSSISQLKKDIEQTKQMVSEFKDSLESINGNGILGLKGTCSFEKNSSPKGRFKSFFRPH